MGMYYVLCFQYVFHDTNGVLAKRVNIIDVSSLIEITTFIKRAEIFLLTAKIFRISYLLQRDLFGLFSCLPQVVRRKLWQEVLEAMNLPTDVPSIVNILRNQYSRFLLSYEMKFSKSNSIDDMKINLLEGSGIPPPNATVTCSEAIIPTNSLTQSQRPADTTAVHGTYSSMTNESLPNLPPSYNMKDGYPESSYDSSKMFPDFRDNSGSFPMNPPAPSSPFGMPQYPYGGERRSSLSNNLQGGLPPYMMSQRNMHQGPSPLSQFYQQSSSQAGHPAASYQHAQYQQRASPSLMGSLSSPHSMIPSASPQDKMHSLWGSQYSPSAEPDHMVDYPPGAHSGRIVRSSSGPQAQFSPAPPYGSYPGRQNQYSPATPPYRPSPSPSPSSRQPMAQPPLQAVQKMKYPAQQAPHQPSQQQQHAQQAHPSSVKREMPFPNDCIETTRPVFTKKRKLTSRDLGMLDIFVFLYLF